MYDKINKKYFLCCLGIRSVFTIFINLTYFILLLFMQIQKPNTVKKIHQCYTDSNRWNLQLASPIMSSKHKKPFLFF